MNAVRIRDDEPSLGPTVDAIIHASARRLRLASAFSAMCTAVPETAAISRSLASYLGDRPQDYWGVPIIDAVLEALLVRHHSQPDHVDRLSAPFLGPVLVRAAGVLALSIESGHERWCPITSLDLVPWLEDRPLATVARDASQNSTIRLSDFLAALFYRVAARDPSECANHSVVKTQMMRVMA